MNIHTLIQNMIAIVKADDAKKVLPLVAAFFSSIAANPTALNIAAQFALLNAQILAVLPAIGQDVLTNLATSLNAEVQAAVAAAGGTPATTGAVAASVAVKAS